MPRSRSASSNFAGRVLALLLLVLGAGAEAAGIRVESASGRMVNDIYMADVTLRYDFSKDTLEALRSGVPLTVVVEIDVNRARKYLWDATVATVRQGYRIERHALSDQLVITNLVTGNRKSFPSLDSALVGFGDIDDIPVLERKHLDPAERYKVRVRARLDIESLPAPMRPLAYLSLDWRLSSRWYTWELET